ncbi:MAG: HAMP domain-containing protein [Salinibacterium sp.]|nr:MAG: HAMP domain-containing protein [Salinibacterium sp.]
MKWRLVAALIATTLLVVLVQDVPLSFYLQRVQHDRIVAQLERDAFVIAGTSEEALETPGDTSSSLIASVARRYQVASGARVIVVDSRGTAIVTSDADDSKVGAPYSSRPEIRSALGGKVASGTRYSSTLHENLLYVAVPVLNGNKILGAVRITYPARVVDSAVTDQLRQLWIVALTTALLAGVVGYIVAAGVTRRLGRLRASTERLADGHLDERSDEKSGAPELRSLARSFNVMAERLEGLIDQQRAFASDASHQLRTPLTALRLKLELARDLIETDPSGARERLAAAESEADRLGTIIEGLLVLSRLEATTSIAGPVDVAAAARARLEHWLPLLEESEVRIRFEGPAEAFAQTVPMATEQIVDNFVDNALSVSPSGSTILVRVDLDGDHVVVHVLDEGPGMSLKDCARAFDRFWRGSSRPGGSGLGLAIVAQLATASGGTAKLEPRPGGGLDASVRFSVAATSVRG